MSMDGSGNMGLMGGQRHGILTDANFNALSVYVWAKKESIEPLLTVAKTHVLKNAATIFNEDAFLQLSENDLSSLLEDNGLMLDEVEVFKHVVRWADAQITQRGMSVNEETRREKLVQIKRYIRFPLMTHEEFTNEVLQKSILNEEEQHGMMRHFNDEEISEPKFNYTSRSRTRVSLIPRQGGGGQADQVGENRMPLPMNNVSVAVEEDDSKKQEFHSGDHCGICGIQYSTGKTRKLTEYCGHSKCWFCTSHRETGGCSLCGNSRRYVVM